MSPSSPAAATVSDLHSTLLDLSRSPCPVVPNPDGVTKRASVAVVIRINPNYSHWPDAAAATPGQAVHQQQHYASHDTYSRLSSFFAQEWVRHGAAEVLFIKRSIRQGDRWQGHVALPGGRRDPDDADDMAAAVREAWEEVGLDLNPASGNAICVGNLPQRIVTTSWGRVPLLVLCPYVFLVLRHDPPPLRLQPEEVASTHWVAIAALQSPALRVTEYQDVSHRLAKQERGGLKRWLYRIMLGEMEYAAIRLVPSESVYCSSVEGFLPEASSGPGTLPAHLAQPLPLWGLTLSVMADLLDMLPPHNALDLWTFPTFTPPDVRLAVWLVSYRFRRRMRTDIQKGLLRPVAIELGLGEVPNRTGVEAAPAASTTTTTRDNDAGIDGLGSGRRLVAGNSTSAIGLLLEEYYPLLRTGIGLALGVRALAAGAAIFYATKRWRGST